jgi:hypothetical protein
MGARMRLNAGARVALDKPSPRLRGYRIHTLPGGRRLAGLWRGWARFRGEIEALEEIEEIVCVLMRRSGFEMFVQR